jgi:hypothetical protein
MIGAGRRGIAAPAQDRLRDCLRPPHRLYRMGDDVLFDYDLRRSANAASANAPSASAASDENTHPRFLR